MTKTPITVGIPFFNAEKTLHEAIRSVFAQTYQEWELLLVDDGSTDRSVDIAYSIKDSRVRVLVDGANRKLAARLNQIINEAKYKFIARMDADDLLSPHRFYRQVNALAEQHIQMVTTGMVMLTGQLKPIGIRRCQQNHISMRGFVRGYGIAHASIMARTQWFVTNHYDENAVRMEDAELWCRTFHEGTLTVKNLSIIDDPLYFCREESGITLSKVLRAHVGLRRLIRRYGPIDLGLKSTTYELIRSYVRSGAVSLSSLMGLLPRVTTNFRNHPLKDLQLRERVEEDIQQVLLTKVPGLD